MQVDMIPVQMHIYICASCEIYICRFLCAKVAFGFGRVSLFVPTIPNIRKRVQFTVSVHSYTCMLVYLQMHIESYVLLYTYILLCIYKILNIYALSSVAQYVICTHAQACIITICYIYSCIWFELRLFVKVLEASTMQTFKKLISSHCWRAVTATGKTGHHQQRNTRTRTEISVQRSSV